MSPSRAPQAARQSTAAPRCTRAAARGAPRSIRSRGLPGVQFCWTFTDREGNTSTSNQTVGTVNAWTDLGQGLAGSTGIPSLVGTGSPTSGGNITLDLTGAAPNAPGALVVSPAAGYLPLFGGTFVPSVLSTPIFVFYTTDGNGDFSVTAPWPATAPDCATLFFQAATLDAGAVSGFSYSNAQAAIQL